MGTAGDITRDVARSRSWQASTKLCWDEFHLILFVICVFLLHSFWTLFLFPQFCSYCFSIFISSLVLFCPIYLSHFACFLPLLIFISNFIFPFFTLFLFLTLIISPPSILSKSFFFTLVASQFFFFLIIFFILFLPLLIFARGIPTFCNCMHGTGDQYAKWNKPVGERQIPYDVTYKRNLMNKRNWWAK